MSKPTEVLNHADEMATWPLEVRALLTRVQRHTGPQTDDRRRLSRRPMRLRARLHWTPEAVAGKGRPTARVSEVYTRDVSDRVVSFLLDAHISPGQQVEIELPEHCPAPQRFACRVRRCRQFDEGWFEAVAQVEPSPPQRRSWSPKAMLASLLGRKAKQ